jgi:hypothetical protein
MKEAAAADKPGFQGGINEPRTESNVFWLADFIPMVTILMGIVHLFAKRGIGDRQEISAIAPQCATAIVQLVRGALQAHLVDIGDFLSSACACGRASWASLAVTTAVTTALVPDLSVPGRRTGVTITMIPEVLLRCPWNIARD